MFIVRRENSLSQISNATELKIDRRIQSFSSRDHIQFSSVFCENIFTSHRLFLHSVRRSSSWRINMKSDVKSNLLRNNGNDKFIQKLFQQAIVDYNQSLCLAETTCSMSLAYANRSAVYFEVKRYKLCLENIQLAKEFGYPEEKCEKLNEREKKCIKFVKTEDESENLAEDFFSLSHESHEKIPFVVDGIEMRSDEKYGNYLISNRDIRTGEVIAVEEPFVKILDRNFRYERCANCLTQNYFNLIPCGGCADGENSL